MTATDNQQMIEYLKAKEFDYSHYDDPAQQPHFPEHMRDGLERWVKDGILPGGFLTAVLCNDLALAAGRADEINQRHLCGIVSYIYNRCPSGCWGSPEKVKAWVNMHAIARHEEGPANT